MPKVSVVMSVYNGEQYVQEAIDSIVNQTFKDFEFIIINDGSKDKTLEIMQSYNDRRIILLNNQENIGLTKSLNKGIGIAKGKYIARQDVDDISIPERLEKEVNFLDAHPEIAVVGTYSYLIDDTRQSNGIRRIVYKTKLPTSPQEIHEVIAFYNPMVHGSVMFRKEPLQEFGFYNSEFQYTQDYDLWLRVSRKYKLANIPECLYLLQYGLHNISKIQQDTQERYAQIVRGKAQYGKSNNTSKWEPVEKIKWSEIKTDFEKAIRIYPDFQIAKEGLSVIKAKEGLNAEARRDFKKAINLYEEVLKLFPSNRAALAGLAGIYANLNNTEKAEQYLSTLVKIEPVARNYLALFNIEIRQKKIKLALQSLKKCLQIKGIRGIANIVHITKVFTAVFRKSSTFTQKIIWRDESFLLDGRQV